MKDAHAHIRVRIADLQAEIRRIQNTTMAGVFANPEDRNYWVERLKKLNGELAALEKMARPRRINTKAQP